MKHEYDSLCRFFVVRAHSRRFGMIEFYHSAINYQHQLTDGALGVCVCSLPVTVTTSGTRPTSLPPKRRSPTTRALWFWTSRAQPLVLSWQLLSTAHKHPAGRSRTLRAQPLAAQLHPDSCSVATKAAAKRQWTQLFCRPVGCAFRLPMQEAGKKVLGYTCGLLDTELDSCEWPGAPPGRPNRQS